MHGESAYPRFDLLTAFQGIFLGRDIKTCFSGIEFNVHRSMGGVTINSPGPFRASVHSEHPSAPKPPSLQAFEPRDEFG